VYRAWCIVHTLYNGIMPAPPPHVDARGVRITAAGDSVWVYSEYSEYSVYSVYSGYSGYSEYSEYSGYSVYRQYPEEPMASFIRGEVLCSPEMYGHKLTESIGGRPEAAARWSVGSTCARWAKVAYLVVSV
jgi:hypothetical protein